MKWMAYRLEEGLIKKRKSKVLIIFVLSIKCQYIRLAATKAAIGYTYDEGGTTSAVAGTVSSEKRDSVSDNEGNNDG